MSTRSILVLSAAALVGVYACTLDFGKWEGELPAGGNGGTPAGGMAGDGGVGATGAGATGGVGGVGGVGGGGMGGMLPASCTNGVMDGDESDLDCGGSCLACDNDQMCGVFSDCKSQFCNSGTCAACAVLANCADASGTWCDTTNMGGTCVPTKDDGVNCGAGSECTSTFCTDDVCCDAACAGTCQSCLSGESTAAANGTCAPVYGNTDPEPECGAQVCNGVNACASFCGLEPPPPGPGGAACPAICTGGCSAGVCTIDCAGAACLTALTCPAGYACNVLCDSNGECDGIITCPDYYACNVTCSGNRGCDSTIVNCSATGTCSMSCTADPNNCIGAQLNCGDNECVGTCAGASTTTVNCPGSPTCTCTTC